VKKHPPPTHTPSPASPHTRRILTKRNSAGKRLPPFPSDDSSETTAENGSSGGDPPPAVVVAVLQEADRIIAAASDAEGATGEGVGAKPLPASVSAEGVAETTVGEGSAVASKAAVTQQSREETSKSQGGSLWLDVMSLFAKVGGWNGKEGRFVQPCIHFRVKKGGMLFQDHIVRCQV